MREDHGELPIAHGPIRIVVLVRDDEHVLWRDAGAFLQIGRDLCACVAPGISWPTKSPEVALSPYGFRETGYRYILRSARPADRKSARFSAWLKDEAAAHIVPAEA
jgi:hypothetical protein